MSNINTKPIVELIRKEANEAAKKVISEASDRAATILERSAELLQASLQKTKADARLEADQLEDRMLRMSSLEQRKDLVIKKRALIDEAFQKALARLNQLPDAAVARVMESLLLEYANGGETLIAGAVNDGFFTERFVEKVNLRLKEQNKPGSLSMLSERIPGVCGLIIKDEKSEINCTFEALLESRREGLESGVADMLFSAEQV